METWGYTWGKQRGGGRGSGDVSPKGKQKELEVFPYGPLGKVKRYFNSECKASNFKILIWDDFNGRNLAK